MSKVLIIDDYKDLCWSMEIQLRVSGYEVKKLSRGLSWLVDGTNLESRSLLLELCLCEENELDVLRKLYESNNHVPIAIITGK